MQSFGVIDFFYRRYTFLFFLATCSKILWGFRFLIVCQLSKIRGSMVQMVENVDPGEPFQCMELQKGKIGLQVFHNCTILFQYMVCLESYKIWVFKNMQTIRCSILWPVHDINACHTLVWTVDDIPATIRQHIRYALVFISSFLYGQHG